MALPTGRAVLPPRVVTQPLAAPIAHVERGISENEIGLKVGVQILVEGIGVVRPEVVVNAADREVHLGQPPGGRVGLLPVHADIADPATMAFGEFLALDEHATRATAGVVHAALIRRQHLDQQLHYRLRRVKLAAPLAFSRGKHAQKILVHTAQNILATAGLVAEANRPDQVDQFAEAPFIERRSRVIFRQDALDLRVGTLDRRHRLVDQRANVGLPGICLQE